MDTSKYQLGARLGAGGMAEVFRATKRGHDGWERPVAIKRIHPELAADGDFGAMFVREAHIAARLRHSNIVGVIDFLRDADGALLIAMELVEGRDLRLLARAGRLPVSVTAYVVSQLLDALAYAHEIEDEDGRRLELVHRDVSPHNVLISWDGEVKLSDFGIAKLSESRHVTGTGVVRGKAAYLSPEQANGLPLDGRSDLFAVGIILHELLTGKRLFSVAGGARESVVIHRVLSLPIDAPRAIASDVPESLSLLCMKLLERDRDRRFQSARAAFDALVDSGEVSLRGQRELAHLMTERFPEHAPVPSPSVPAVEPERLHHTASTESPRALERLSSDGSPEQPSSSAPAKGTFTRALEAFESAHHLAPRSAAFTEPLPTSSYTDEKADPEIVEHPAAVVAVEQDSSKTRHHVDLSDPNELGGFVEASKEPPVHAGDSTRDHALESTRSRLPRATHRRRLLAGALGLVALTLVGVLFQSEIAVLVAELSRDAGGAVESETIDEAPVPAAAIHSMESSASRAPEASEGVLAAPAANVAGSDEPPGSPFAVTPSAIAPSAIAPPAPAPEEVATQGGKALAPRGLEARRAVAPRSPRVLERTGATQAPSRESVERSMPPPAPASPPRAAPDNKPIPVGM